MDKQKSPIDFAVIAKKVIEKTSAGETRVLFRFFPVRGVAFDQANSEFFKGVLSAALQGVSSPISLTCVTLDNFPIIYSMYDVGLHDGLCQEQVNICSRTISGNFLLIACPFLHAESEAIIKIDSVAAILRLSFGNFIAWPRFYEIMVNVEKQEPDMWFPQRTLRMYDPKVDGPFLPDTKGEGNLEVDIRSLIFEIINGQGREHSLALSLIEDAAKEENARKKVFLYFSAIQSISGCYKLNDLINIMKKHYKRHGDGWDILKHHFGETLLLEPVTVLRHNVIHNGWDSKSFPILERYLQILCLEVLESRLQINSKNLLEKFIQIYGASWWMDGITV